MTPEQLASVKRSNRVRYGERTGKVTRDAPTWFMITWDDDETPEIIRRADTVFTRFLELET